MKNKIMVLQSRGILPSMSDFKCYVDASYAGDEDTWRSTTRFMLKICGGPVSWKSRMKTSVALSSMESEYMAASAAAQEALWLNRLLQQHLHQQCCMRIIKQLYYLQIILVTNVEVNKLILEDISCVRLWLMVKSL